MRSEAISAAGTKGGNHHTQRRVNRNVKESREAWKDKLRVSHLMNILAECGDGRVELTPTRIKAIEVLLDRLVPRLSSVEQVEVNALDQLSREEILARIQALIAADPTLLPELVALDARDRQAAPRPAESAPVALTRPKAP